MIIHGDETHGTLLIFFKHTSDAIEKVEEFLATVCDRVEVDKVRTDNDGEFVCVTFKRVRLRHRIKHEVTTADPP